MTQPAYFVEIVLPRLHDPGPERLYNADQTETQKEIHTGRTLEYRGMRQFVY